jgi:hypothetical protein
LTHYACGRSWVFVIWGTSLFKQMKSPPVSNPFPPALRDLRTLLGYDLSVTGVLTPPRASSRISALMANSVQGPLGDLIAELKSTATTLTPTKK